MQKLDDGRIFDIGARQAISGQGDILARDLRKPALQTVIAKWRGLERLKYERLGDQLTMRVLPNDGTHRRGQEIAFEIDDIRLPYLTFFSLSGDGTLHFHYPLPEDPETLPSGRPVKVAFTVTNYFRPGSLRPIRTVRDTRGRPSAARARGASR